MNNVTERTMLEKEIREQIRAEQRAYQKSWREKNPDKVRAANERYWLKKAAQIKAREA